MGTINVKLSSGEVVPITHPDDWSDEQIENAIHESFPEEMPSEIASSPFNNRSPKTTGFKGLAVDVIHGLQNALKRGKGFIKDIPKNLEGAFEEQQKDFPGYGNHAEGQILASLAESGKGILNLPYHGLKELGEKELIPQWLAKWNELPFTHIPEDTGIEKFLGLEPNRKGDELVRAIPDIASLTTALGVPLTKGAKALMKPNAGKLKTRALEDAIAEAGRKSGLSGERLKAFEDALRLKYSEQFDKSIGTIGEVSPIGQQVAANEKATSIEKLRPEAEIPEKKVPEIPPEPDFKAHETKAMEEAQKAQEEANDLLGVKSTPRLKAANKIKPVIEKVKETASNLYNAGRRYYVDKKVLADNSAEIKAVTRDLEELKASDELAPGYGSGTAEQKALEDKLQALKTEKVNASDVFDLQQTLETMADNARAKQFQSSSGNGQKMTQLERDNYEKLANRLDAHAEKLRTQLESVGGDKVQSMFKEANKGWRIWKDMEKRNPIGKGALKGEIPVKTLTELEKAHPGNDFLNALVDADPELRTQLVAAYNGESNLEKVLHPNDVTQTHLAKLPEVQDALNAFRNALKEGVKEGKAKDIKVKKDYNEFVDSVKKEAARQQARQAAQAKSTELTKQIKFHKEAIPKLEKRIMVAKKRGENVAKLEEELKQHKRDLEDKNHRLKKLGYKALGLLGVTKIANTIGIKD